MTGIHDLLRLDLLCKGREFLESQVTLSFCSFVTILTIHDSINKLSGTSMSPPSRFRLTLDPCPTPFFLNGSLH